MICIFILYFSGEPKETKNILKDALNQYPK